MLGCPTNQQTTQHSTNPSRCLTRNPDPRPRVYDNHRWVVSQTTDALPKGVQTEPHDHPNTNTHRSTQHNTLPSHITITDRTEPRIQPFGTPSPRSQLACTDRYQIHPSCLTCRLTTAQPDIHPEETSPQPNRYTLANDGRRDSHGSPTRPDGRTFPSTHLVPMPHSTTTTIWPHTNPPTPSRPRAHHRPRLQHRTNRIRRQSQNTTRRRLATIRTQPSMPPQPRVWGHDHDGAYRQLPLDDPSVAYVLLITPDGPTLWHHHVLLFGSAASVWAYNRFGPVLHYVDDYGSIEPSHLAESGFHTFEQLNCLLGFHMKPSKRQPPDKIQKDSRRPYRMRPWISYSSTMPRESQAHLQPTPNTPTNTTNDTRTSQETRRKVFLYHNTPLWTSRQISTPSTIRQSIFQQWHSHHTNTKCHLGSYQHPSTLLTETFTTSTNTHQTHHHIHRRLLHWRRQTTPPESTDTRPRIGETFSRDAERLGSSYIPPRFPHPTCFQWHSSSETPQTLCL